MVSKKRLNCGFNGYRAPIIPKAPRSIRRRRAHRDLFKDSKLCAFDLLAAVAGKLLQESESSTSSNVAEGKVKLGVYQDENGKQQFIDDKASKSESLEHGSYAESAFVPENFTQECNLLSSFKGLSQAENDSVSERTSILASSDILKQVDFNVKLGSCEVNNAGGNTTSKVGDSICEGDNLSHKIVCGLQIHSEDDKNHLASISTVKDHIEDYVNTDILINPENSVQLPLYREPIPDALLQKRWNNVKVGIRDDDDNSFGCNKSSIKIRRFRPQPCIGRRRIRKMLALKYRKATSKLKGRGLHSPSNSPSEGMRSFYRYRKRIYTLQRCQQAPVKKRKLSDHRFAVACDQDTSCNSISNLPEKGMGIDKSSSPIVLERDGASATALDHQKAKDSHVKFSIKSFRVPELYIEVPENASVGSLKRTVMEAVTSILGCGIKVGVVLQGKKVRDDNKTLQQAGISESSDLDTLGFTLEPRFTQVSPSMTCKKLPPSLSHVADQQLLRSAGTPVIDSGIFRPPGTPLIDPPPLTKCDGSNEFLSSPRTSKNEIMVGADPDSKALVPVLPMNTEALAVVPVNPKPKRNELSQRRTRRPFSVAEVEALVEAVEKLGTGRWRDVKIGAFENADHRTYVDLKDKWKTLVHTASISPQQRRGEPVPQELLDRVLSAHSYWLQHQSKQHGKHPVEPLKTAVVDLREEIVRA